MIGRDSAALRDKGRQRPPETPCCSPSHWCRRSVHQRRSMLGACPLAPTYHPCLANRYLCLAVGVERRFVPVHLISNS